MDHADAPPPVLPPIDPSSAGTVPASSLTPELLASLLADGDDELAAWALRHALVESSRAEVCDSLIAGAMRIVGERWEAGEWSVADEHFASQTLVRALDLIRPPLGPESRVGPLAVLGAPAGEQHVLGLICLEQCLRERGWQVANLGADVPAGDLAAFVAERQPALIALAASDPARADSLRAAVAGARAAAPSAAIAVGGRLGADADARSSYGVDWAGATVTALMEFAAGIAPA